MRTQDTAPAIPPACGRPTAPDCAASTPESPSAVTPSAADPTDRPSRRFGWATAFWIALLHTGALAAPWTFSWSGLAVLLLLGWITGGLGICLGYHRLFTHGSFATFRPLRWAIALMGTLAGQGSVIHWTANHRKHHARSDREGDPHSPRDGFWWSHMLWLFPNMGPAELAQYHRRWAPDLVKDPVLRFLDRTFLLWNVALGVLLYAAGWAVGGPLLGLSWLVWGLFLRLVYVLHATWLVNSASHCWGYRNYATRDDSRNNWLVALLTYGEGWHNNHHAFPRLARAGHRWWELDVTYGTIRLLGALGLAWNIAHQVAGDARRSQVGGRAAGS